MNNFCTLFDSNYFIKGLTMYKSLRNHCDDFHLYIFAFDDKCFNLLSKQKLPNVSVIPLNEFEDPDLLMVKPTRTPTEYCWTCTPSTILYCIEKYHLKLCTYIDADLYFYSDPKVLIDEMGDKSVLITKHRYTPEYDQTNTSGKYCVQFISFKADQNGFEVLKWWRNACLNWCYNHYDDGKFGDQKYLDDWTTRFTGIHELKHLGGGVAPWNMQQYTFIKQKKNWIGTEISTRNSFALVFFHFHQSLSFKKGLAREFMVVSDYYSMSDVTKKQLYIPYVFALIKFYYRYKLKNYNFDGLGTYKIEYTWSEYFRIIKKRYKDKNNAYFYWIG